MKTIMGFSGDYGFLSNFYLAPLEYHGIHFPTSENAYQWAKVYFFGGKEESTIQDFERYTPGQAKREGQKIAIDTRLWNKRKYQIMYEIVQAKFDQNPDLAQKLLDTGDAEIIELNNWGDVYWGAVMKNGKLVGDNRLGEILMLVRSKLRGWGLQL